MIQLDHEMLKSLSFAEYLRYMSERIKSITYSKNSSSAYLEAREISKHIIRRYILETNTTSDTYFKQEVGNELRMNDEDLNNYSSQRNDKGKESVIFRFKDDMDMAINHILNDLQNT